MSQKAILTVGIQGSGKSTWAIEFLKKYSSYKRVNRDFIRHQLSAYQFNDENEKLVQRIWKVSIEEILDSGYNLILDEMNLNKDTLNKNINFVKLLLPDIEIEIKYFPCTLEEAIQRDSKRDFVIGKKIIKNTWDKYKDVLEKMLVDYKPVEVDIKKPEKNCYDFNYTKDKCWCIDIDGTLALKHPDRNIYDGAKVEMDIVIQPVYEMICAIARTDNQKIIICSGREEKYRGVTENWLSNNNIYFDKFFMRKTGDKRQDSIVKKEIYKESIEPFYNVIGVFDDRPQVLRMWQNELGLFTFAVNQDVDCLNDF